MKGCIWILKLRCGKLNFSEEIDKILRRGLPQHGMLDGVTSLAHKPASSSKAEVMPIFLDEQGTWMATLSFT